MIDNYSNESLIKYLIFTRHLFSSRVIEAFYEVNRSDFVREECIDDAYYDMPLSIGYSQTISQPQVVSLMLEILDIHEEHEVLDIGAGSGYTTALLSKIVGNNGFVYGIEKVPQLVDFAKKNISKYQVKNALILEAKDDLGIKGKKFDRILVSASAKDLPYELIDQLKIGGKLVIPIKKSIYVIEKKEDSLVHDEYRGFSFVPLVY